MTTFVTAGPAGVFKSLSQPMGEFWIQLLALLTLLTQTVSASDTPELIRTVGKSATFRTHNTEGNAALWSFGNDPILTVAFRDPPRPIFSEDKFKTRFTVSERGRALSISQLRMEDAGTYSVNIDGKISTFILRVYRELPEPTVTCEAQDCLDKVCLFALRCSCEPDTGFGNVSYTWRGWDHLREERPVLLKVVDTSSLDKLEPLRCTARNAVSSRSVTVTTPEGLCPENSVHPPGPGAPSDSRIWISVLVGVTVLVVILLVLLVFFCKSQGESGKPSLEPWDGAWKKFRHSQSNTTDTAMAAEYMMVYTEVGPSQQHIPNGINAEPTGGESSSTVHSLVKRPEQVENATVTSLELV